MNDQEKALATLTPTARKVFQMIDRYGPLSAPDLRIEGWVAKEHPEEWKGRAADGMTDSFRPLQATGLIRATSERTARNARIFEVTPPDEIERQAKRYQSASKPKKRNNNGRGILMAEITEAKRLEKEAGTSARAHVIEARRGVVELTLRLMRMKPMVYWKCTRDDEIAQVYEAAVRLEDWAKQIQAACDWDRTSAEQRERIRALRRTEGRGLAEAEVYRRKADELEAGLDG